MSYQDQGFNEWFEKSVIPKAGEGGFSALDFDSLLEDGSINTSLLADKVLTSTKLRENIIKNLNVQALSRNYKAVVTTDNSGTHGSIQEAIDYVSNQGGGTVFINEGTYEIDENINLKRYVNLLGSGKGLTILNFKYKQIGISLNGTNSVGLGDCYIANMTLKNSYGPQLIFINFANNTIVTDIDFQDNYDASANVYDVFIRSSTGVVVKNCNSSRSGGFVKLNLDNGAQIFNNIIEDCYGYVFFGEISTRSGVYGNKIIRPRNSIIKNQFQYLKFYGNIIDSESTICTNIISGADTFFNDNIFNGNTIQAKCSSTAITLTGLASAISNNSISEDNNQDGILISGRYCVVSGNKIQTDGATTVSISGDRNCVSGNTILADTGEGVNISGDNNAVSANAITMFNVGTAVVIAASANKSAVVGNTLGATTGYTDAGTGSVVASNAN